MEDPTATRALNAASTASRYTGPTSRSADRPMIDNLSLAISHGLMLLTAFLLCAGADLDHEPGPGDQPSKAANPADGASGAGA